MHYFFDAERKFQGTFSQRAIIFYWCITFSAVAEKVYLKDKRQNNCKVVAYNSVESLRCVLMKDSIKA